MSETSVLISSNGKITRVELKELPTPPATATHVPIPHSTVVDTLVPSIESPPYWRGRRGVRGFERWDGDLRRF